jgi:molybdopterin molybdotransferase
MKTAAEALNHLLSQAKPEAEVEVVSTQDALGRILASDILSQVDVPPMNNTQMDGYAVRVADVQAAGQSFVVSQRIPAGHVGTELASGTIARIFTGATIPTGADAVVMQEDCTVNGDQVTFQEVP